MGFLIEFFFRVHLAAFALVARAAKTVYSKWSDVDQVSAIVCIGMFTILKLGLEKEKERELLKLL